LYLADLATGGTNMLTGWELETVAAPAVVGRRVFYNNSAWDGDVGASVNDDAAIAPAKTALLPGGVATFANYTSYSKGLNGIMVDIANLAGTPTVSDFTFKVGNDNTPAGWVTAPAPASLTSRGLGGGVTRLTLIWHDADGVQADRAVTNQWLQVTVLATANTGLAAPDVFYFGNAIGDSGNSPPTRRSPSAMPSWWWIISRPGSPLTACGIIIAASRYRFRTRSLWWTISWAAVGRCN